MNRVQQLAYSLIEDDAKFIYTLCFAHDSLKNNYIVMALPYIGLFTDGAEQWGKKVGLSSPLFSEKEKKYYTYLRNSSKLLSLTYDEFYKKLFLEFKYSDNYFYQIQSWIEKNFLGYRNVGVDFYNGIPCGNTILCGIYTPFNPLHQNVDGNEIKKLSEFAGRITGFYINSDFPKLNIDNTATVKTADFHFFKKCPLKHYATFDSFCLYSILCAINYNLYFIECFTSNNFTFKLRAAYLQYYYLLSLLPQINRKLNTNFFLSDKWFNPNFRNCMAHYGLGQVMNDTDILTDTIMGGLIEKVFHMDYYTFKRLIFKELALLKAQLEQYLF